MAEQPVPAASSALLPTQQANHFAMAINPNEFLISVGQSRMSVEASPTGAQPLHHVEWLVTLSIGPVAASHLIEILKVSLKNYEETFGKIPTDPSFKMTTVKG
jgi:hypothetical protein